MRVIPIILAQHAEDAAVLWGRRAAAVNAPHFNVMFLQRLDDQLEAHLDGLRVAGEDGWQTALAAFEDVGGAGEVFALTVLAVGHDDTSRMPALIEAVQSNPRELIPGAVSGIGWLPRAALHGKVSPMLSSRDPVTRAIGIGACAVHRVDPKGLMAQFLEDVLPVRQRALRLAGELGRADMLTQVQAYVADPDPWTAYWAAWSGVLLGDRGASLDHLLHVAEAGGRHGHAALRCALPARGREAGGHWLDRQGTDLRATLLKIDGYAILGDVSAVPWLIDQMGAVETAQKAGEAFTTITGLDLELEDAEGDMPPGGDRGPTDDPGDPNVALDADADLPWPEPDLVRALWARHARRMPQGAAYLGHAANRGAYAHGCLHAMQRQRRLAAYWIATEDPAEPLPQWKRPTVPRWPGYEAP